MDVLAIWLLVLVLMVAAATWFVAKVVRVLNKVETDLDAKAAERKIQA